MGGYRYGVRKQVKIFSRDMERRLKANDYKGGWEGCETGWLLRRLAQELGELRRAIRRNDAQGVILEAADVANFAMMIADNTRIATALAASQERMAMKSARGQM